MKKEYKEEAVAPFEVNYEPYKKAMAEYNALLKKQIPLMPFVLPFFYNGNEEQLVLLELLPRMPT